jgi:hypothetical protein
MTQMKEFVTLCLGGLVVRLPDAFQDVRMRNLQVVAGLAPGRTQSLLPPQQA